MAINKVTMAALKAMSYADIDIKKNYKLERQLQNIIHPAIKPLYHMEDYELPAGDYRIPIRIFTPSEQAGSEILLFFHGGGWVTGNIDNYTATCAGLSDSTGRRVISVEYGLAPEHPFPHAVNECYQAARRLFTDCTFLDEKPEEVILIGDSAGGNLCAVISLMARDKKEFSVGRQILIYPSTYNDHSESSPFPSVRENGKNYLLTSKRICDYMDLYIRDPADWNNPYFAPLLAGDLSGQPKTLLITAEYDPLRDEGEAYGEKLKEFGTMVSMHRIPDAIHGFFSLPVKFEQVKYCHKLIKTFLSETEGEHRNEE